MQPNIKEVVLSAEREEEENRYVVDRISIPALILSPPPLSLSLSLSILPEIQHIFGHLMESHLQYYTPDAFWKKFKLEGQPINVHEHQVLNDSHMCIRVCISRMLQSFSPA